MMVSQGNFNGTWDFEDKLYQALLNKLYLFVKKCKSYIKVYIFIDYTL